MVRLVLVYYVSPSTAHQFHLCAISCWQPKHVRRIWPNYYQNILINIPLLLSSLTNSNKLSAFRQRAYNTAYVFVIIPCTPQYRSYTVSDSFFSSARSCLASATIDSSLLWNLTPSISLAGDESAENYTRQDFWPRTIIKNTHSLFRQAACPRITFRDAASEFWEITPKNV